MEWEARTGIGAALSAGVAALAYRRRALTGSGAWAAILAGTVLFAGGGWTWVALVGTFFLSSSLLTRWEPREPRVERRSIDREGRRWDQVAANGGVAVLAAAIHGLTGWPLAFSAAAGAIAAATADTWGTEVGRWSLAPPRLITTWVAVPPGASGGVTPVGTAGTVAGAVLVGGVAAGLAGAIQAPRFFLLAAAGGISGAFLDSLLGATVEGRWRWLGNSLVNLIATAWGGAVVLATASWWR